MKVPRSVRVFGLRLAVCLVVLGGVYVAIFGARLHPKPAAATPPQKLAAVRSALDEVYLSGNTLAGFRQSDAKTFLALNDSQKQFGASTDKLAAALAHTPDAISSTDKQALLGLVDRSRDATQAYRAANGVLSQVIGYDPANDLGLLAINAASAEMSTRALAAQKGLQKALNDTTTVAAGSDGLSVQSENGPALLVNDATRAALKSEADCFGQLHDQLEAKQLPAASQTRSTCIAAYPALRRLAAQNVTVSAWGGSYHTYAQATVPPLLKRIDSQLKTLR